MLWAWFGPGGARAWAQPANQSTIAERIEALGGPDDGLPDDRRPARWLAQHADESYPALLEALDHPNPEIAQAVLGILDRAAPRPALAQALLRVATAHEHPLSTEATYALCRFGDDARVKPVLAKALASPTEFADSWRRACFAEALGDRRRALALLDPFLRSQREREVVDTIARLATLGHAAAIASLARLTRDPRWEVARAALLALATLAPRQHGLSQEARQLLALATRTAPRLPPRERQQRLAALPREKVRPLVLAMLRTDARSDALAVLTRWNDRAALPNVKALLDPRGGPGSDEVVRTYLSLASGAGAKAAADEIVRLATKCADAFACLAITRGVADASSGQRAYVLGQMQERIGHRWPDVLPRGLRQAQSDIRPLLGPLFMREEDPRTLGLYAQLVATMPSVDHAPAIRRALALLLREGAADRLGDAATSTRSVLDAIVASGLSDLELEAALRPLLTAPDRQVRRQATCAAALQPGGGAALAQLHRELDGERRAWAAQCLSKLPWRTEAERGEREAAVLALLGSPAEDHALRVLVGCMGPRTTSALLPILDGPSVARAVHAAWALAHSPDRRIAERGLRRLALHGVLHQGETPELAMRFAVAPDLVFEQTWPGSAEPATETGFGLPFALLPPRQLDPQELDFLMRDYRARAADPSFRLFSSRAWHEALTTRTDASWAPFFDQVAAMASSAR